MKAIRGLMLGILLFVGAASLAQDEAPAVTLNTWSSGAAMPTAVWQPAGTAVLKKQIYVVGGVDSSGTVVADTQVYDPTTNSWTSGVPLPTATEAGSAAVVKNILYILGGFSFFDLPIRLSHSEQSVWAAMASGPRSRQRQTN